MIALSDQLQFAAFTVAAGMVFALVIGLLLVVVSCVYWLQDRRVARRDRRARLAAYEARRQERRAVRDTAPWPAPIDRELAA